MRIHLGAGAIYLREYVNIDLPQATVFLAKERPDLVEQFITTEDKYYARHEDKTTERLRGGAVTKETVCDVYGSFGFLPARPESVSEILARQVFEHLDKTEARQALRQCNIALRPKGLLRIDIPDPDETLRQYHKTGDEFYIRHLFGPRKDLYGYHTHYTRNMLTDLAMEYGFSVAGEEPNIHFYPAFCLRLVKTKPCFR